MSRDYFRDRLGRFAARPDGTAKAIQIVIALWHLAGYRQILGNKSPQGAN